MAQRTQDHPNLLIIITDQQSSWTLGCYGGTAGATPHVDGLAREGALLSNYFANAACCTPSRGCFFTGLYSHQHGAPFNDLQLRRDVTTMAHVMQQHGYDTSYIGKWHLDGDWQTLSWALQISGVDPDRFGITAEDRVVGERDRWVSRERSMGFEDCRWMFNCSHAKRVVEDDAGPPVLIDGEIGDEQSFMTDWLTSRAIEYVGRPHDRPFFLTLSIPDPHDPFSVRSPFDTMFDPQDMAIPDTFHQTDVPEWLTRESVTRWHRPPQVVGNEETLRRAKAQYLGEVACIDHNVGRLMSALERTGILDETIVVFTTDHGEYMGEHGIYAKNQLYETAYHIPFVVRYPALVQPGHVVDQFVTTVDAQQTLLGLLGLRACGREQGRDASPLLRGEQLPWQDEAFIYGTAYNRAGIFTPEYELAYIKGEEDHILFDRREDPLQVSNLFHSAASRSVVAQLTERLIEHNRAIDAPEAAWLERVGVR